MRRLSARGLGTVSFAAIAIAGTSSARAQDQPDAVEAQPPVSVDQEIADAEQQQAQGDDQAIVVTGSRLRRTPFNSPDPLTIVDPELALREGEIETAEILQTSPVAAGSPQLTATLSSNFVNNGGFGAQTVGLRGLGPERTLVLLDGRRAGPAGTRGSIASFDLNVLPTSVIQSVEILKTGASSIYGSDAVAGVINLIIRRDLDGFEARGFTSISPEGGGETYNANLTFGQTFDRGHFILSADYFRRNELTRRDRSYLNCEEEYLFSDTGERRDIRDPRTGDPFCSGTLYDSVAVFDFQEDLGTPTNLVTPSGRPITLIQFNRPGDRLDEFLPPLSTPTIPGQFGAPADYFPVNFDGPSTGLLHAYPAEESASSIIPRTERLTLFAAGAYQLTPNIELFTQLLFNNRKNYINGVRQIGVQQFTGDTILPFFFCEVSAAICDPNATGDPLNTGFSGDVVLLPLVLGQLDFATDIDYYRAVGGARGDFGGRLDGWRWEGYLQYSRSDGDYTQDVIFQDALETQELRTGLCAGTATRIRGVPCVDINWTDPRILAGDFNQQERDFLFGRETGNTVYTQWTGELTVAGDLFRLPAGDVQLALGVQWRRDSILDTPGEVTLSGNSAGLTGSGITAGHSITKEAFAEIEVPLIHETPLIQDLTLSAAARLTNVSATRADGVNDTDNGNFTYKVGLNWAVNDWLRFRGTYGTSYRAPALFEQFLANETGFLNQTEIDPCLQWGNRLAQGVISQRFADNCAADGVPNNYTGGGTGDAQSLAGGGIGLLDPETSRAWTASVILTPRGSLWRGSRFSLVVDYFDIKVTGEITQLGAQNILRGCYNSEFFPDDPLCGLFDRVNNTADPRDNQITEVRDNFLNINSQRARGIDVTARLSQDLGPWGSLLLQAQMTWQLEDTSRLFENTLVDDNGEAGDPIWIGDFNLTWRKAPFTIVYGLDVVGGTSNREDLIRDQGSECFDSPVFRPGAPICPDVRLSPAFYHSLSLTTEVGDRFEFTLGVSNMFDRHPPRASTVFAGVTPLGQVPAIGTQYDLLGRRFFASFRARF